MTSHGDGTGPRITLVRHAATRLNAERRYQGHVDPPLSAEGEAQARALAGRWLARIGSVSAPARPLPVRPPSGSSAAVGVEGRSAVPRHLVPSPAPRGLIVYTSDLRRAAQTTALALPEVPVIPDARLRELDFGAFDGRTFEENLAAFGDVFLAWIADPASVRPPGGESLAELETRLEDWFASLRCGRAVIAFTHGGPIAVLLARFRGVPFSVARAGVPAPAGLIELGGHRRTDAHE